MPRNHTELGPVSGDPKSRTYEACVTFREQGAVTLVPCALTFPVDADRQTIGAALIRQAEIKRRAPRMRLVSRLPTTGRPNAPEPPALGT